MLFMSFCTVPAVHLWTCHPKGHHFMQQLRETEKGGQEQGRGKEWKERKGGGHSWDEADGLVGKNHNLCVKTRTPIKQENLSLQHNDEAMTTGELLFFPLRSSASIFGCSGAVFQTVHPVHSSACCWTLVGCCLEATVVISTRLNQELVCVKCTE